MSKGGDTKKDEMDAPMTQEEFDRAIAIMSPEQIQYLSTKLLEKELKERKVMYGGKKWSLWDLGVDLEKNEKMLKAGGGVDTIERMNARGDFTKMIPGEMMRQGQEKMQLRPKEEEMFLGLDLIGGGTICSPKRIWGVPYALQNDFSFGIYADEDEAKDALEYEFAGRDPKEVLTSQRYYEELVNNGPNMELTLMLFPLRDIPLHDVRLAFHKYIGSQLEWLDKQIEKEEIIEEKVEKKGKKNGKGKQQEKEIVAEEGEGDKVSSTLQGKVVDTEFERASSMMEVADYFSNVSWFDRETKCIKKHSQFIFTCHEDGNLTIEAISPGKLSEQKPSTLGMFTSKPFTYSLFSTFMGPNALDAEPQVDIGRAFLFVINGFSMRDTGFVKNINRRVEGEPPNIIQENIKASPDVFSLERVGHSPRFTHLLEGVRRAKLATMRTA